MSTRSRLPAEMLVVICDSRKALLLRNSGSEVRPSLEVLGHIDDDGAAQRLSDRPGRRYDGGASAAAFHSRSAMEQPDPARRESEAFADRLIDHLTERHRQSPMSEMLIAAPPAFLGILRDRMPSDLARLVSAEVPKRLTGARVDEIADTLVERW